eukprot:399920_1
MMSPEDNGDITRPEEWVSIDHTSEYMVNSLNNELLDETNEEEWITMDEINDINDIDSNGKLMSSEEYIIYLKSLWNQERQNNEKILNKHINKNNSLKQQLHVVKKQNIQLQNELNFLNSKIKHQKNNNDLPLYNNDYNNYTYSNEKYENENDNQKNVVSKLWNHFIKPKPNNSNLPINTTNITIKLERMEQSLNEVQHLQD